MCLGLCFACRLRLQSLVQEPSRRATLPTWSHCFRIWVLVLTYQVFDLFEPRSNCLANRLRLSDLSELLMLFCPPVSPTYIAIVCLPCAVLRLDDRPPTIRDLFSHSPTYIAIACLPCVVLCVDLFLSRSYLFCSHITNLDSHCVSTLRGVLC